jgi:hypothetical protein
MRVKATKPGYFGKLRQIGDEFEAPDAAKGSWFEPVDPAPADAASERKAKPKKADDPAPADAAVQG